MTNEQIIEKLADLPLVVRGSQDEVFKTVRELQEAARQVSVSLLDSDSQAARDDERRANALAAREDWQRFDWDGAKPYKEHLRERLQTVEDYLGYLNACHEEGPDTFALAVQDVLEFAATAMCDKCVEKVKASGAYWCEVSKQFQRGDEEFAFFTAKAKAADDIERELEPLTLDQVKAGRDVMTNEKAPERIYMHPTSAEANVNPWPLEPGEYVEYVRVDLASPASAAPVVDNEVHCWHCGIVLERTELKPRCDECSADCDDEFCNAFGCAPSAAATAAPGEQKQPLPEHFLCVEPDLQPTVINFLRGFGTDADKAEAERHLHLCLRCQELANAAPVEQSDTRPSCWHCGVVLAYAPKLRCEDCPEECDVEGCDELGCAPSDAPVEQSEEKSSK